jgi:hypothetical protein
MIVAIAAFFLAASLVYEIAPASSSTLSQAELADLDVAGRATREFLATFSLPGTPDPIVGTPAEFFVLDDGGVWRAAPVIRIQ